MDILLLAKDELEEQGVRWVLESHLTGITILPCRRMEEFEQGLTAHQPALAILNMDGWNSEGDSVLDLLKRTRIPWLGLSSERIFQTAYRALRYKAEDVLFRPFSSVELVKSIQQIRYQLRNRQQDSKGFSIEANALEIDYTELFINENKAKKPVTMTAFLTPNPETLSLIYEALHRFSFTLKTKVFVLTNFILCVQESDDSIDFQEEYRSFMSLWKERSDDPLAIVTYRANPHASIKDSYQQVKKMTKQIFFSGYDTFLVGCDQEETVETDPLLTPAEQQEWIGMLANRDEKAIRDWIEREFLMCSPPYPDPEIIRIRLTSVLAQVRRYMKSHQLEEASLESDYYHVFKEIIQKPVIYQILNSLLPFLSRLFFHAEQHQSTSITEKVQELIRTHYSNPQWTLADCAEALGMNKSTLSRRFTAESDTSFREMLHEVRIREAKRLLAETDLPLEEISRLTGYTHQSYFNAKFKKLVHQTPFSYRQSNKMYNFYKK
ncbi:helix-turn-helix domain-containing protein [Bacillus massilinigeriensis]|uniref:helix-turn-helix domain-containing protein n=1 Tax=Bacillus mediterraneensis TaxID=1805474 RepID=UPI0008F8722E|nr:helix-turn-helix domain-containing protein [Bacillus mediterraneensis]